jgi:hypothetical protein
VIAPTSNFVWNFLVAAVNVALFVRLDVRRLFAGLRVFTQPIALKEG